MGTDAGQVLRQIEEKEYAARFRHASKKRIALGIAFDNHDIADWRVAELG